MVEKSHIGGLWPALYEPLRAFGARVADWVAPAAEASSGEDAYRITMELPGVAEEDIELTVDDGVVSIRGEKRTEREEKGETWYFSERQYGAFARSFRLPGDADAAGVKAVLDGGVLTVTVPRKTPVDSGAKRIAITRK